MPSGAGSRKLEVRSWKWISLEVLHSETPPLSPRDLVQIDPKDSDSVTNKSDREPDSQNFLPNLEIFSVSRGIVMLSTVDGSDPVTHWIATVKLPS